MRAFLLLPGSLEMPHPGRAGRLPEVSAPPGTGIAPCIQLSDSNESLRLYKSRCFLSASSH